MKRCTNCGSEGPFFRSRAHTGYYWEIEVKCVCGNTKYIDPDEGMKREVNFEPDFNVGVEPCKCKVKGCEAVYYPFRYSDLHEKYPFCPFHRKRMTNHANGGSKTTKPPIQLIDGEWIEVTPYIPRPRRYNEKRR